MQALTFLLSVLAVLFAAGAVFVNTWQLKVARVGLGGRAFTVQWTRTERDVIGSDGITRKPIKATLRIVGPGTAHDVHIGLDGIQRIKSRLEVVQQLTSTSEPIVVEFEASKNELKVAWLVVVWSSPTPKPRSTDEASR